MNGINNVMILAIYLHWLRSLTGGTRCVSVVCFHLCTCMFVGVSVFVVLDFKTVGDLLSCALILAICRCTMCPYVHALVSLTITVEDTLFA